MTTNKILSFDKLGRIAAKYRNQGLRVVLCHGMFDLVHLGHIRHFTDAKTQGDVLIVTTTADRFSKKGPGRPVFEERLRLENIAALEIVDHVGICPYPTALEAIQLIHPTVFAKGIEYQQAKEDVTGMIDREREAVEALGSKVYFTDELVFSSSTLLNEHMGLFEPKTREYLIDLAAEHPASEIIRLIENTSDMKVLIVGETIIDRYTYSDPMGQSGKGNQFVVRRLYSEDHAGGALAVVNHLASFLNQVDLLTAVGKDDEASAKFVREHLQKNVDAHIFEHSSDRTIVKERFVDQELNKYFEVYHADPDTTQREEDSSRAICNWLSDNLRNYDLVVVADYGNGLIDDGMTKVLTDHSKFLAVNTQINSANRGYHVVTRYDRADYVSLNELELQLALHNRKDNLEVLVEKIASRLGSKYVCVTAGPRGLSGYDRNTSSHTFIPALASRVIDRVGAGDAFLALSALCFAHGMAPKLSAFVGAAAAALDVQIVGNKRTINRVDLFKYITALLK